MARTTLVIAAVCVTLLSAEVAHAQRFTDNNDGTVTDHQTGLIWEKKTPAGSGGVHDVNNTYTWCDGPRDSYLCRNRSNLADGTIFTVFLATLNYGVGDANSDTNGCFANHCDWRIPSSRELRSIYDRDRAEYCREQKYRGGSACIDPAFGPTQPDFYASATTSASTIYEDGVVFAGCCGGGRGKTLASYVRAVRYDVKSLVR
jgi:hypothetical protein